jgi:hypothetical protein
VELGVPVSVMLGLSEGPAELEAVKNGALFVCESVTLSPSGSVAEPVTDTGEPSVPLTVAGAEITGFRFRFAMETEVVAVAVPPAAPSFADQLIVYEPDWVEVGVPVSVMLGLGAGPAELEDEKKGALFVWERVTFWPSGSEAEPVAETDEPSVPLTVAGAVINGFWFVSATLSVVVALVEPAVGVASSTALQLIV